MSSYLSRLVNRSLNPVSTVQPRLTSRFEPRPDGFRPVAEPWETVEQTVAIQEAEASLAPLNPLFVNRRFLASSPLRSEASQSTSGSFGVAFRANRPTPDSIPPATTEVRLPTVTPAASSTHPVQADLASDLPEPEQATPEPADQLYSIPSPPHSLPMVQSSESVLVRETIVDIDQSIDQIEMPTRSLQPSSHLIQPAIAPLSSIEKESVESVSPSMLPTIQVKIGRIDIRAIPAAQPVRQTTRSVVRPPLSLADYLRSRQGRRQ